MLPLSGAWPLLVEAHPLRSVCTGCGGWQGGMATACSLANCLASATAAQRLQRGEVVAGTLRLQACGPHFPLPRQAGSGGGSASSVRPAGASSRACRKRRGGQQPGFGGRLALPLASCIHLAPLCFLAVPVQLPHLPHPLPTLRLLLSRRSTACTTGAPRRHCHCPRCSWAPRRPSTNAGQAPSRPLGSCATCAPPMPPNLHFRQTLPFFFFFLFSPSPSQYTLACYAC